MNQHPFIIRKKLFDDKLCDKLLMLSLSKSKTKIRWENVFGDFNVSDRHRMQAFPPEDDKAVLEAEFLINQDCKNYNPTWIAKRFAFLKSTPGGQRQGPHRDYLHTDLTPLSGLQLPGSAIMCLEDEVRIGLFGVDGFRAILDDMKIAHLKKGDVLFFRGDVIHCGMAYEKTNTRLHCFLDNVEREIPNVTQHVSYKMFYCSKCQQAFDSKADLNRHIPGCKNFNCPVCPRMYKEGQKAAYRAHMRRKHHHPV